MSHNHHNASAAALQARLDALRQGDMRSRLNRLQGVPDVAPSQDEIQARLRYGLGVVWTLCVRMYNLRA